MIRNERQYRVSAAQRDKLAHELARVDEHDAPAWVVDGIKDSLKSQMAAIESELTEYELLQTQGAEFSVPDLASLPRELVRARISRSMSQRDLAEVLGVKEQQIQRYEATDYAGASVGRISDVMTALGVRFTGSLDMIGGSKEGDRVRTSLTGVGLSSAMVKNRFFASASTAKGSWMNAASRAARIFKTSVEDVLAGSLSTANAAGAFRAVSFADRERLTGYAVYAEYLAELATRVCSVPYRPLPSVEELREELGDRLGADPLRALLDVCWDHGIPVVPVTDSGAFYGACWFFDGRPAIVLKNQVRTPERWAFLLAHEMEHTRDSNAEPVLESELAVADWHDRPDERSADANATRLLLGDEAESMAVVAVDLAEKSAARLKSAVRDVAEAEEVSVGLLADYVAHRVARPGINWWATANSLHSSDEDAWLIARAELFSRAQLDRLDSLDRDILIDGMAP